ncbi:hypothetical protein BMETH_299611851250, partial [methanotrophic bacterial endosymbiont of Bathymodiolus sp.]
HILKQQKVGAVIHYLWLVKSDLVEPLIYASIMFVLLGSRLLNYVKTRKAAPALVNQRSAT